MAHLTGASRSCFYFMHSSRRMFAAEQYAWCYPVPPGTIHACKSPKQIYFAIGLEAEPPIALNSLQSELPHSIS